MSDVERREERELLTEEFIDDHSVGRAVALVLAGIGIGAGLAMLLTPKRGDEVREAIGRGYRRAVDELNERAQDLRSRALDLKEDLQERAPNLLRFAARRRAERRFREG
jgi:hypothetical protein